MTPEAYCQIQAAQAACPHEFLKVTIYGEGRLASLACDSCGKFNTAVNTIARENLQPGVYSRAELKKLYKWVV